MDRSLIGTVAWWLSNLTLLVAACSGSSAREGRFVGQTSFDSSPGPGIRRGDLYWTDHAAGTAHTVYRFDGNRLYSLNAYRGLLVYDVTDIDHPLLIGRSPMTGAPVEMLVRSGVVTVVMADWYGKKDDGTPFYGSVVRDLEVTDAAHIRNLSDLQLSGWVREARFIGDVLYIVSDFLDVSYDRVIRGRAAPSGRVTSISLVGGGLRKIAERSYGFINAIGFGANAILLVHDNTRLTYLDVSSPTGSLLERASIDVPPGWTSFDFANGKIFARTFRYDWLACVNHGASWFVTNVDFSNPDLPSQAAQLTGMMSICAEYLPGPPTMLDSQRLYFLGWNFVQIYDLSDAAHPVLASEVKAPGSIVSVSPRGTTLLIVGGDGISSVAPEHLVVTAFDVTDAAHPKAIGTAAFGNAWTWTPDASTFKPFIWDDAAHLLALPFSGWDGASSVYRNGVQLFDSSGRSISRAGLVMTQGWIEQGIFAIGRLLAVSDSNLAVIDDSDHQNPRVISEQPVARNTTRAVAMGEFIVEFSGDFLGKDVTSTTVRVLPISQADDPPGASVLSELRLDGVFPGVFRNGSLLYVLTMVKVDGNCWQTPGCRMPLELEVIDLSGGVARLRSKLVLPGDFVGYLTGGGPGWVLDNLDWGDLASERLSPYVASASGNGVVQIESDLLAIDNHGLLDLHNPDAPAFATIAPSTRGHFTLVGNTLYAAEREWLGSPREAFPWVRYWLDKVDLSDRAHPRIATRVNVPGIVLGSSGDLIYVEDFRWSAGKEMLSLDVLRLQDSSAQLLGLSELGGPPGPRLFLNGSSALLSEVSQRTYNGYLSQNLHQLDLSNPAHPSDQVVDASESSKWLLSIEGDCQIFSSGWGGVYGLDIFRVSSGVAPRFDRFLRAQTSAISVQGKDLFVASGPWGVETIRLGE